MYLLLVVLGVVIGYVTKLVALQLLFRPLPGWPGVVARNADRAARVSAELVATRLLEPRDVFARIDPDALTAQVEQPLLAAIDEIVREVLREHHHRVWEMLPVLVQDLIVKQVQAAAPRMVEQVVSELRAEVGATLDARALVTAFRRAPDLAQELSRPERAFVVRCGLWSGLVLGVVQAVVWGLTSVAWVLPVSGAVIGGVTTWLALLLVFFPRAPRRVLGVTVQGAFPRRRERVAVRYGELVAHEVITVSALVDAVTQGPQASRVAAVVGRVVAEVVDERLHGAGPEMKQAATAAALRRLPAVVRHAEPYLTTAMDLERTITARVRKLNAVEFEALLRPAFRSQTWVLITTTTLLGAALGAIPTLL